MRVLFITRKYPPQIGGMENYSYGLISNIDCEKELIALKGPQRNLIWFFPLALVKSLFLFKKIDIVYLCDSFLAPLGYILKKVTKKPVVITAHGLDVTYNNLFYRMIVIPSLKKLDRIICVSRQTIKECTQRGIDIEKCFFIPNGFDPKKVFSDKYLTKDELAKQLGIELKDKKIIITVGRLVKRKGTRWFIENILTKLDDNVIYFIIGEGEEKPLILELIEKLKLEKKAVVLGFISDQLLKQIYRYTDVFIMPNIKIPGDVEGFGIVALEAAAAGIPVLASKIEGIRDSIHDGINGILIDYGDTDSYVKNLKQLLSDNQYRKEFGEKAKNYTLAHNSWKMVSNLYHFHLQELIAGK